MERLFLLIYIAIQGQQYACHRSRGLTLPQLWCSYLTFATSVDALIIRSVIEAKALGLKSRLWNVLLSPDFPLKMAIWYFSGWIEPRTDPAPLEYTPCIAASCRECRSDINELTAILLGLSTWCLSFFVLFPRRTPVNSPLKVKGVKSHK